MCKEEFHLVLSELVLLANVGLMCLFNKAADCQSVIEERYGIKKKQFLSLEVFMHRAL